jgi:hypothetical protein
MSMRNQNDRDRDKLVNNIMELATEYRYQNRLCWDDWVVVEAPLGFKHLLNDEIRQFLNIKYVKVDAP